MLELTDITKGYGIQDMPGYVPVLKSLSVELSAGESMAVLGPSGCGKSTLLNIIGALDKPSQGQVLFMGEDLTTLDDTKLAFIRNKEMAENLQESEFLSHIGIKRVSGLGTIDLFPESFKGVS